MMLRLRAPEIRFTRNGKAMDTAMQHETLQQILELARWAPSGDNAQPWRFEIVDAQTIRIHGFDTRDHVLYDYDGRPSQIAHGALIETLRIAASGFGLSLSQLVTIISDRSTHGVDLVRTKFDGIKVRYMKMGEFCS